MKTLLFTLLVLAAVVSQAQTYAETLLYSFGKAGDGTSPISGLTLDTKGNLYGTTASGGINNCGTVFKLTPKGVESVLHKFTCGTDGGSPVTGVVLDKAGNLYGTAFYGKNSGGVLFKITSAGKFSVLHQFGGSCGQIRGCYTLNGTDGKTPLTPLLIDSTGTLYGATAQGGSLDLNCADAGGEGGCGTVFKLTSAGVYSILHNFTTAAGDAEGPSWNILRDGQGNLYGTAYANSGIGALWEITAAGQYEILNQGNYGDSYFARNAAGNFYGTFTNWSTQGGEGAWEITGAAGHVLTTDYFCTDCVGGSTQGWFSVGSVVFYNSVLYGVMEYDGANDTAENQGCGTVFSFNPATGTQTVLYSFLYNGGPTTSDGCLPQGGVVKDSAGNFYGTTAGGGTHSGGVVFKLTPQ